MCVAAFSEKHTVKAYAVYALLQNKHRKLLNVLEESITVGDSTEKK